jgi:hypothetical protein
MMLTIEERKRLQYNLIMDDIKPHRVMSLSDDELIEINRKNDEYMQKLLSEPRDENRNKGK